MRRLIDIAARLTESVTGDVQGVMRLGDLVFDQRHGIGNVPDNGNIGYLGFAVIMTPSQFFRLAAPRDFSQSSNLMRLQQALTAGQPIASPFLDVRFDPKGGPALVRSHEGRTRCKAIEAVFGASQPVLVHVFIAGGERARHLTLEQIAAFRMAAIAEKTRTLITGPFFRDEVYLMDGWQRLPVV